MQRLIRERGKDNLLDLKPGSLYHAIDRLQRGNLIEPVETSPEGRRPERTTYRLTEEGLDVLIEWLRDMLSRPSRDSNEFLAALAHLPQLPPLEVADLLQVRADFLSAELASMDSLLHTLTPRIGRIVLLEIELARAWKEAELHWVQNLVSDLRKGVYSWDIEELLRIGIPPGYRIGHRSDMEGGEPMA